LARKKNCVHRKDIPDDSSYIPNDTKCIPNDTSDIPNDTLDIPNDTSDIPNDTKNDPKTRCEYCKKVFSTQSNKIKHMKVCKMKSDEIWALENECKIEHKHQECNLQCKYCKNVYSRTSSLTRHIQTCKTKEDYIMVLTDRMEYAAKPNVSTINNNTTNNIQNANTINNNTININVLGKESLEHITLERIESLMKGLLTKHKDENVYLTTGEAVIAYHKVLHEDENNRNIIIPHERRQIAYVKREEGGKFEKEEINNALEDSFCNSSQKLNEHMTAVEDRMGGFAQTKTTSVHRCTKSMGKKGTRGHPDLPRSVMKFNHRAQEVHRIKRGFKIANTRQDEESGAVI